MARINPLESKEPEMPWQLKLETYGFSSSDLSQEVPTCGFLKSDSPLLEIVNTLKSIYCGKIGIEYMDVLSPEMEA